MEIKNLYIIFWRANLHADKLVCEIINSNNEDSEDIAGRSQHRSMDRDTVARNMVLWTHRMVTQHQRQQCLQWFVDRVQALDLPLSSKPTPTVSKSMEMKKKFHIQSGSNGMKVSINYHEEFAHFRSIGNSDCKNRYGSTSLYQMWSQAPSSLIFIYISLISPAEV